MAKPRPDSWEYPTRFLNKRMAPVKALSKYLRENNILFFLKNAEEMALKAKFGPALTIEDIPETVPLEHREELVKLCNAVLEHYEKTRAKRAAEKAKIEQWRQKIPENERERLLSLAHIERASYFFDGNDHWQASLETLSAVETWLTKTPEEKAAWFARVEEYIARKQAAWEDDLRRSREETRRMYEEYCRTGQFNYRAHTFSSFGRDRAATVLGISLDADSSVIKAAWRRLVKVHHPDAGGDPGRFQEIQSAYEILRMEVCQHGFNI